MPEYTTDLRPAQVPQGSARTNNVVSPIHRQHFRISPDILQRVWPKLTSLEIRVHAALIYRIEGWSARGLTPPRIRAERLAVFVGASTRRVQMAIKRLVKLNLVSVVGHMTDHNGYTVTLPPLNEVLGVPNPPDSAPSSDPTGSVIPPRSLIQPDQGSPPSTLLSSIQEALAKDPTDQGARGGALARERPGGRSGLLREIVRVVGEDRWGDGIYVSRCLTKLQTQWPKATDEEILAFARSQMKKAHVQAAKMPPALALSASAFGLWIEKRQKTKPELAPAVPRASSRELASGAAAVLAALKGKR